MNDWDFAGDLATVVTAAVAVFGYGKYWIERVLRRKRLECYLKSQKELGEDKGQRSVIHIMARTGLTEAEIFQASRDSRHIARRTKTEGPDEKNKLSKWLLFEYERNSN